MEADSDAQIKKLKEENAKLIDCLAVTRLERSNAVRPAYVDELLIAMKSIKLELECVKSDVKFMRGEVETVKNRLDDVENHMQQVKPQNKGDESLFLLRRTVDSLEKAQSRNESTVNVAVEVLEQTYTKSLRMVNCRKCANPMPCVYRPDGVSVECPRCRRYTLTQPADRGFSWFFVFPCEHFQQVLRGDRIKVCQVCGLTPTKCLPANEHVRQAREVL